MSSEELPTELVSTLLPTGRRLVASVAGKLVMVDLPARGRVVLGRGSDCDVVLDDASISRKHAAIDFSDGMRVEDLGSANGTMLGGKRLAPNAPTVLTPGVALQLGTVLISVEGDGAEDEPEPIALTDAVVEDPVMIEVHELVRIAASSQLSVLLLGETGVGKELFARRIHELSTRAKGPLVRVNCAALVESLLEAELFGYERGAFTGANTAKPGLLEAASGGTLFLDEVGEMPLPTQAKLLRVLESGEVMRVGALKPRTVDVRFVSATHRDVRSLVGEGRFREDLFFRLEGVSIRIPPLRERKNEIVALAKSFIKSATKSAGRTTAPTLTQDAEARLIAHGWSGNVRELRNVIQRSVLFCRGDELTPKDLQFDTMGAAMSAVAAAPVAAAAASPSLGGAEPTNLSPDKLERRRKVIEALEKTVWNQTRAAELLGISRRTLQAWLIELDIPRPRAK